MSEFEQIFQLMPSQLADESQVQLDGVLSHLQVDGQLMQLVVEFEVFYKLNDTLGLLVE